MKRFAFHMPAGMRLIGKPPQKVGPTAYFAPRAEALAWLGEQAPSAAARAVSLTGHRDARQSRAMNRAWVVLLGLCGCGSRSPLEAGLVLDASPATDGPAAMDAPTLTDASPEATIPKECYRPNVTVLAADEGSPTAIAVDATHVYWATSGSGCNDGLIRRMPKAGGAIETLASNQPNPRALDLDQDHVYFYDACGSGLLRRVPKQGGPVFDYPITVVDSGRAMAVGGQDVYFSDYGLLRIAKSGGKRLMVDSSAYVYAVAADATGAYWMGPVGGGGSTYGVFAHAPGSVGATVLANPAGVTNTLGIDQDYVYFGSSPGIRRVSKKGGAISTVATGSVWRLAVDDSAVYWTDGFGGAAYTINKAPKSGGPTTVVATGSGAYVSIAVDDRCVYWADLYGGDIRRAPK